MPTHPRRIRAFLLLAFLTNDALAFAVRRYPSVARIPQADHQRKSWRLMAESESETPAVAAALPPSKDNSDDDDGILDDKILSEASKTASVTTMISQANKRVLIEELGYRRPDIERMRFELAPSLIEQRVKCPVEGMPASWCRSEEELSREKSMMDKLEDESKYPLKLPLLATSLVLFGKGFGDALITLIKVSTDFPGASLTEEFSGVPVLLIDAVCTVLGTSLGWWTWKTMK